jgi:7-cyano-7-deazaguanine synthase
MSRPVFTAQRPWLLLSGGLDSATLLALWCQMQPASQLNALWVNYGQRNHHQEYTAAQRLCAHYGVNLMTLPLDWLTPLLPQGMRSQGEAGGVSHRQPGGLPTQAVWVPNRNGLFINMAATLAEAHGGDTVWFGANRDEAEAGFPDNSEAYRQRANEALALSTLSGVRLEAPLADVTKTGTVALAAELGLQFNLIWSCYEAETLPCGQCASCSLVQQGLAGAGLTPEAVGLTFLVPAPMA